jgi:GTP-binding protein EngB required for normal cell division
MISKAALALRLHSIPSQDLHLFRAILPPVVRRSITITSSDVPTWAAHGDRPTTNCYNSLSLHRHTELSREKLNNIRTSYRWIHSTPAAAFASGGARKQASTTKKKSNTKQHSKSKHSNNKTRRNINPYKRIPNPLEQKHKEAKTQQEVPPAYLVKTASDYAYIAKCVIMDERTGELHVDPRTLFTEVTNNSNKKHGTNTNYKQGRQQQQQKKRRTILPQTFRHSHLHYFPPSTFPNYEPPTDGTPEVAFLGRSNTGKSSLINALSSIILRGGGGGGSGTSASGGGELARTSKRPGRTQTINYFGLIPNTAISSSSSSTSNPSFKGHEGAKHPNSSQSKMFLVDLPGFGYASAPDQDVDAWQEKTQQFLISRASSTPNERGGGGGGSSIKSWADGEGNAPPLTRLYLLLDSRLPQPTLLDLTVMGWCDDYAIPYTLVLTKVDGSSRAHCVKLTNQLCMRYHSLYLGTSHDDYEGDGEVYMDPVVYWTSSKDGLGMEELLMSVENNLFSSEEDDDDEFDLLADLEEENDPEYTH